MKQVVENINGLHVIHKGAGRHTLVFLHYFGGSAHEWEGVIGKLEGSFHCIAIDMRGFGKSAAPQRIFSVQDYTEDLLALFAALQLGAYTLIGHSMSGKIALSIAARQPMGLQSLVLIAPSPPSPEPMKPEDRDSLMNAFQNRPVLRQKLSDITGRPLPAHLLEQAVDDNMRASQMAWTSWLEYGSKDDITPQLPEINIPVSIIVGAKDQRFTAALMEREIKARLPQTSIIEILEVGHLIPLEAPDEVAEAVATICAGLAP